MRISTGLSFPQKRESSLIGRDRRLGRSGMTTLSLSLLVALVFIFSCNGSQSSMQDRREAMVKYQLEQRGINDSSVLNAFRTVPREKFILPQYRNRAYDDVEAPILFGESLDRPFENAVMISSLGIKPTDKVLEIGTGTGYFSSLMSHIAKVVYTIEIEPSYADAARRNLSELGIKNVHVKNGDGFLGWPEKAPFNVIVMACSPPQIPIPLIEQLVEGGNILAPIGGSEKFQELVLYTKKDGKLVEQKRIGPTTFTPMKGIILEKKAK